MQELLLQEEGWHIPCVLRGACSALGTLSGFTFLLLWLQGLAVSIPPELQGLNPHALPSNHWD